MFQFAYFANGCTLTRTVYCTYVCIHMYTISQQLIDGRCFGLQGVMMCTYLHMLVRFQMTNTVVCMYYNVY